MLPISARYAAGFIDADGTIYPVKTDGVITNWRVEACQSDANGNRPLVGMRDRWGGSLCKKGDDMWKWSVSGLEAALCLYDLQRRLDIKKGQAERAIRFFQSNERYKRLMARLT